MNRKELEEILKKEQFRSDAYNLNGGYVDESLTLGMGTAGRWLVYYCERGSMWDPQEFQTESEACDYLLSELRRDPTTRLNSPSMTRQRLFEILRKEEIREANGRWFVRWTESGEQSKETEFATESEASAYIWNKIKNVPPS